MANRIVVVGGGYVGLPFAMLAVKKGMDVTLLDVNENRVERLARGESYITDVPDEALWAALGTGRFRPTAHPENAYGSPDLYAVVVCVPTPLQSTHDPDLSFVHSALDGLIDCWPWGSGSAGLVALESTVYPGFTREVLGYRMERAGKVVGKDVFVSFSPERVDPGNRYWTMENTPKVVGGMTPRCSEVAQEFYRSLVERVVPISSVDAAEMVKILENTFRWVNIGLVNEMAMTCRRLGIDIWEVIKAASTKQFGFMPFYPGPGVGGHCIAVDPYYLEWKMRTLHVESQFVHLAGRVNTQRTRYVVEELSRALNDHGLPVNGSSVIVVGVAYKSGVSDVRESPALEIINDLAQRGAKVSYLDRMVPELHSGCAVMHSESPDVFRQGKTFTAALVVTDQPPVDYHGMVRSCRVVVDTRNVVHESDCGPGTFVVRL